MPDLLTVQEAAALAAWIVECEERDLAPYTLKGYRGVVDRYIVPMIGNVELGALNAERTDDWREAMSRDIDDLRHLEWTDYTCWPLDPDSVEVRIGCDRDAEADTTQSQSRASDIHGATDEELVAEVRAHMGDDTFLLGDRALSLVGLLLSP